MSYISVFRYLGIYEKSYRSYNPDLNELKKFDNKIISWKQKNNPSETDVVNHIDDLLKLLNYGNSINHHAQTQQKSSSHADIEIINETTQVIIEVKRPSNTNEMPSNNSILSKALYECIWYYFNRKELIESYNIKHLVITDGTNYYFIKPASIAKLKELEKLCIDYKNNKLSIPNTNELYNCIERTIITNEYENLIIWTYVTNTKIKDLYKLLHKNFLLREYIPCDNNLLNNNFYKGLLEIIGLDQNKDCLLVQSKSTNSLIFGIRQTGLDFDNALRLASTWINRLLFLKLFEQQLISFNGGDKSYSFLNHLKDFRDYQNLFFNVLGTEYNSRGAFVSFYSKVPFLGSL